jgi:hypothetical protein
MKSIIRLIRIIFIAFLALGSLVSQSAIRSYRPDDNGGILKKTPDPAPPQVIYYSIDGHVYKEGSNDRFEGVTIEFSGGVGSVVTDEMGFYSIEVPQGWSGVATPSYCGYYSFNPEQRFYTNVKKDYFDQDYTGGPAQLFTISGKFTYHDTGEPISNTEIDFGDNVVITTNDLGEYSIEMIPCTSDTLVPYILNFNFEPSFRIYNNITANYINQDYIGIPDSFGLPPGWDYENTGQVHIISVFTTSNPNLCGVPLGQGDYIGVFYVGDDGELHCGGAGMWNGETNTPVIAQGDDMTTPEKDGFAYGETMNWKIFRWTKDEKAYTAIPQFQTGGFLVSNNKWYTTGLSIVNQLDAYNEHFINIPKGWSGFSSFVVPKSLLVTHIMAPVVDELVIMQTFTKMYYPSQGINTIGLWNNEDGYKIKVTSDVTLPIMGCIDEDREISLEPTWNIFPVLSTCNVSIDSVFALVTDQLIVIKEIGGNNIYWPEMGIATLKTLLPGRAYIAAVTEEIPVVFPDCSETMKLTNENTAVTQNLTPWNTPVFTASSQNTAIKQEALKNLKPGDFIGAFTPEGYCAGLIQIGNDGQNCAVTIFGDDNTTVEKDGFLQDEPVLFKLYRPGENKEFNLKVTYDQTMANADGLFTDNGLSAITEISVDVTGIGNPGGKSFGIFPNPSSGIFRIIAPDAYSRYQADVMGITGNKLYSAVFEGNANLDLTGLPSGSYFIKIKSGGKTHYEKLVIE